MPPTELPKIVTQLGSPPKEAMFPCTQCRAATTSRRPWLPGMCLSPVLGAGRGSDQHKMPPKIYLFFPCTLRNCFESVTRALGISSVPQSWLGYESPLAPVCPVYGVGRCSSQSELTLRWIIGLVALCPQSPLGLYPTLCPSSVFSSGFHWASSHCGALGYSFFSLS